MTFSHEIQFFKQVVKCARFTGESKVSNLFISSKLLLKLQVDNFNHMFEYKQNKKLHMQLPNNLIIWQRIGNHPRP